MNEIVLKHKNGRAWRFDFEKINSPDGRRELLSDPAMRELLGAIRQDPVAFGLGPVDLAGIEHWAGGQLQGVSAVELYENFGDMSPEENSFGSEAEAEKTEEEQKEWLIVTMKP